MRVISAFIAAVLVVIMMTQVVLAAAGSAKSICVPITIDGKAVNPNDIPSATLTGMSNRGSGSYTMDVNLCTPATSTTYMQDCLRKYGNPTYCPATGCGAANFIDIYSPGNVTCLASFDKPLMRPTASKDGFKVAYTSSAQPKDTFEAMILCNPFGTNDTLHSRSNKFAGMTPNKNGGTTYMVVLFSHLACAGGNHSHEPIPTGHHHHSEEPSSDMPPMPSGGSSSDMPSGGSSSDMPSGGSMSSDMPSGGSSSDMPMPSGGSSSDMPSGGSSSDMPPMPSGGSMSGSSGMPPMPSGGGSSDSGMPPMPSGM